MNYYLVLDTKQSTFYVAPYQVDRDTPYLIQFEDRFSAENFLSQVNFRGHPGPLSKKDLYHYDGTHYCQVMDDVVHIFRPK